MNRQSKGRTLDYVIDEMIDVVENSKEEIFNISEEANEEHTYLLAELADTRGKVIKYINDGDVVERNVKVSRRRLSEVSKNFGRYSETEIREIYENTLSMQTNLAVLRQEETVLRNKRDDLERRLITLSQTIERAEGLASKVSVILTYLNDDFREVNDMIENAKEKQEFSLRIIQAQEDERKRISREIHDGPAQMLANILLRSELVDRAVREGSIEHALEEIKSVREMVRSSLYEVRHIIYDLRPMALDDLGLVPTIRKYVATIADYHKININFISIGQEVRINPEYEIAFFRLVQESLQNAVKHAEASLIKVKLDIGKQNVTMVIEDNGKGFDTSIKRDKSFGLIGMKERVDMLEGKLSVESSKDRGARIFITVPYKKSG